MRQKTQWNNHRIENEEILDPATPPPFSTCVAMDNSLESFVPQLNFAITELRAVRIKKLKFIKCSVQCLV